MVGHARELAEVARELSVDLLADVARILQQGHRRLGVELRVAAKKGEEVREGPRELRHFHRCFHVRVNARDLVETNLVDLVRRDVVGRVVANEILVEGLAVRKRGRGDRLARPRHVFVVEERLEITVCRKDGRGDGRLACFPQPRLIRRRD